MPRPSTQLLAAATLIFLASSIAFAVLGLSADMAQGGDSAPFAASLSDWVEVRITQPPFVPPFESLPPPDTAPRHLARPGNAALWVLLVVVWLAVAGHAVRMLVLEHESRGEAAGSPELQPPADGPAPGGPAPGVSADHLVLSAALLAGAAWPWLREASAILDLLGAAVMAMLAIHAALGDAQRGPGGRPRNSVGVFAGWAVVALFSSFAGLVVSGLGLSAPLAVILSVLLLLVTAIEVQLRIGPRVGFSLAIICAMIGFASQSLGVDLTGTLMAIFAITAMTAVMVRVLS